MVKCVGCGYCCSKAPCALGADRFGVELPRFGMRPCKGLVWDPLAGRHFCRLVLESKGADRARIINDLAIGAGCCSSLFNNWRRDIRSRITLQHMKENDRSAKENR